jgi:hypothetical protein
LIEEMIEIRLPHEKQWFLADIAVGVREGGIIITIIIIIKIKKIIIFT